MQFIGKCEVTIDDKNRLSIPATFRAAMDPEKDGTALVITPGESRNGAPVTTLCLYPDRYYRRLMDDIFKNMQDDPDGAIYMRRSCGAAALLEIDKQGRVVLPQWMLERAGIANPAAVSASWDHLVLWNRAECDIDVAKDWESLPALWRASKKVPGQAGA